MTAKRAIFVAPFGELYEPRLLAELAAEAEQHGFDGFFLWDHVRYTPADLPVADPWIALSAIAVATSRLRLGPMVTPVSRRRPHKLARETVTLDHLSGGRLVLGVGLGSDNHGEFETFEDVFRPRERAKLLDEGLDRLTDYWAGGFQPEPLQEPRIPIWVAARWPNRRPIERAVRYDGVFPIDLDEPGQLREMTADLLERTGPSFDVVVTNPAGTDSQPWADAGATWCLTGFGSQPTEAEVRAAIAAGP
jgi:alkanesulfonate monooxygenase SsuD/methylene tetrahydromethanopterin reductase-like flavin-dependent oxidoreductase (luciferase family)